MQRQLASFNLHLGAAPSPERAWRPRRLVLGLGALAVVAVIAGTVLSLWRLHDEVTQLAEVHLRGLAQILGEQSLRSAHTIDAILRHAAEEVQRREEEHPFTPSIEPYRFTPTKHLHGELLEIIAQAPYVSALMLTDASGKLVSHTKKFPPPAIDYRDSEFFRAHRDTRTTHASASLPFIGMTEGERGITVSRAVNDPDARFLGVVAAVVDPAYFLGPEGLHELGPDGAVRLLRRDGVLLTGYPLAIAAAIHDYYDSASFAQGAGTARVLIRRAGSGGGERISAIRLIDGYPLVVTATSSMDFVLRAWYRNAMLFGAIAAATAASLILITLSLARQLRIEEALKSVVTGSEERLHAIIQSAMDAIVTVDAQQHIVLFNAAAEQIFRCPRAQAVGAEIGRFISGRLPEPQAGNGAGFDAASPPMRKTGQQVALTGVRADGAEFPIDASVSQVQLHGAGLLIVILRDITERKRVEAALRGNEQRYRTLFSKATDGILLLDAAGNIVDANDAFARMHGYAVAEVLRMNLRDLDTPESLTLAPERIGRVLQGESIGFEVEHFHKDGHSLALDVASTAIDVDGKRYVLAFHRDITERKRAEQEIKRSRQALRELSKAANDALEAERRRTARELHDELGQSLTALKMDLESLRSSLPPGLPQIEERTQAMHALLDGTIAATRRIAADLRPLMLDDLGLAAALDWLTHNFSNHTGIATELIIDDSVAQVPEPLASALYRITQESLTNVAKYAQATTAEVRLERDGDWVQLLIRDNGRGIEEGEQDKRGTFGLLGIRERVSLLGGDVAIKGARGQGSAVCARIPLVQAGAQEAVA